MNATTPVSFPHLAARKPMNLTALLALIALGLGIAFPGYALDLVAFTGITGPLTSALTQIAALGPGIKALVGFVGFVVALISLSALRNFGPVLFYVGLAIFAAANTRGKFSVCEKRRIGVDQVNTAFVFGEKRRHDGEVIPQNDSSIGMGFGIAVSFRVENGILN